MCPAGGASDGPAVRCLGHHYFPTVIEIFLLPTNIEALVNAFKVVDSLAHVDDVPLRCYTCEVGVMR